jgi:chromosome partitioning protein
VRRISVLNFKGGTGKTSLATNLAYALTLRGARVLLVDCDLQANASSILPPNQRGAPTLTQVLKQEATFPDAIRTARPGLDVLPSDNNLDEAANAIVSSGAVGYYLLANAVEELAGYDFLLLDHSPSYGPITQTGLLASEELLIPVEMAPYAMQGLIDMVNKLTAAMKGLRHPLAITGIVPFKLDQRSAMTPTYLETLIKHFGERVTHPIRVDETVKKAQSLGQTVFEYDPRCRTIEDFNALAAFIMPEGVTAHVEPAKA